MRKKIKEELEVKLVYSPSPDAEERLQRAFEILFKEVDLDEDKS